MAKPLPEETLAAIEEIARSRSEPVAAAEILQALPAPVPLRTLQHHLKRLVSEGRLVLSGSGRWARYSSPASAPDVATAEFVLPLSEEAQTIRVYLRQPPQARKPVGWRREFLDGYRPNVSFYLSEAERARLAAAGGLPGAAQPAGTYARHILNRLLIDLAWNSSRLEGNTYSLLDTRRLIEFGEAAEGRARLETQMILNHKDAIEFLVSAAGEIGFDRRTILNLHALLADNLLADPAAAGRLRFIAVGIEGSVFHPLEAPQILEEAFDQILATAQAIEDPFEQAFFVMVQLPYLQPFDDVNKRVSRLAANIPFIRENLAPLSFAEVPRDLYTEAMLGVYELNRTELLRDLFLWAYARSAERHAAVRQSLGEPDPFRLRHRAALREIIGAIIRERLGRREALARIAGFAAEQITPEDRARFIETAEAEISGLHEGNFARYQIRPSEFEVWRAVWTAR